MMIPEVFAKITTSAKSKQDIVRLLREHSSLCLRQVLHYALIDRAKWYRTDLPPHTPDQAPEGLAPSSLFQEIKRLYIFKDSYSLPRDRKDQILIQILEGIHPKEANVIKEILAGTFSRAYGIDRKSALEAFPDLGNSVTSA